MNQKHMGCISFGIDKHFKPRWGRTGTKHPALQRALPTKDVPPLVLQMSWPSPNLGHIQGHAVICSGQRGRVWEGKPSASPCEVSQSHWASQNNFLTMFFLRLPTPNGRHLKYVLSQSSAKYTAELICALGVSQGSDGICMKTLWLGTDLAWIQAVSLCGAALVIPSWSFDKNVLEQHE